MSREFSQDQFNIVMALLWKSGLPRCKRESLGVVVAEAFNRWPEEWSDFSQYGTYAYSPLLSHIISQTIMNDGNLLSIGEEDNLEIGPGISGLYGESFYLRLSETLQTQVDTLAAILRQKHTA